MKRLLIVLLLTLSIIICLPACVDEETNPTTSVTTNPTPTKPSIDENPNFATYNSMFNKDFTKYTIEISVTDEYNNVVNEKYDVIIVPSGYRKVTYRIEHLNQFIIDGDDIIIPDEYISVESGVYDVEQSNARKFDVPKFNFSYSCLSDSETAIQNFYHTKILSVKDFMGLDVVANNASVKLTFNGNDAESVIITYTSQNENKVVITYTFN